MGRRKRSQEEIASDIKHQSKVYCVCERRKTFDDFYNMRNKSDGKSYRCKLCDSKAKKGWADRNPDKQRLSHRKNNLWTTYHMTLEDYNLMLKAQGGVCAICDLPDSENKINGKLNHLSVDHNHDTGEVRGLLCNQCNRGIGMLQDSSELLMKASVYVQQ